MTDLSKRLDESFDTEPYPTHLVRKDGSFNYEFTTDSGEVYRVQFYPSNGLGTNVRRVYLGHKKGSIFKDVMTKFQDPMRIISTMLASFAEFQATPAGKATDGFVIDATAKAFGPTIRLLKRLAARNPAIRAKFNILDTTYTWDTARSPIWIYRKGTDPVDVFNGKNVDTQMLVDSTAQPAQPQLAVPVAPLPKAAPAAQPVVTVTTQAPAKKPAAPKPVAPDPKGYKWATVRSQGAGGGYPNLSLNKNGEYQAVFCGKDFRIEKYWLSKTSIAGTSSSGSTAYFGTNKLGFDTFKQLDDAVVAQGLPSIKPYRVWVETNDTFTFKLHNFSDYYIGVPYATLQKCKEGVLNVNEFINRVRKAAQIWADHRMAPDTLEQLRAWFDNGTKQAPMPQLGLKPPTY